MTEGRTVALRLVEDVWNGADESAADELVGPYLPGLGSTGPAGTLAWHRDRRASFPDLRYQVVDCVADGDRVAVRWTARGTQTGAFGPVPPTGRAVAYGGATFLRVTGGRVVDLWSVNELASVLEQLGVAMVPPEGGRG